MVKIENEQCFTSEIVCHGNKMIVPLGTIKISAMIAMKHTNGKWKFKLLPPRQQPKHRKNGMDNNNTNNINRFAIINNEIGSRYSAKPDPTNDHTSDPTTDPTFEPTFEVYVYNYL